MVDRRDADELLLARGDCWVRWLIFEMLRLVWLRGLQAFYNDRAT